MKVSRFEKCEDGSFTDGNIVVTDIDYFMKGRSAETEDGDYVFDVPDWISCHCIVHNKGMLLTKLTLCFVFADNEKFNIGTLTGSVRWLDKGDKWEFYGRTESLGYVDPDDDTTGDNKYSKERGTDVYESFDTGWKIKVYAIEEFADEPDEDLSGSLGSI